MSLRKPPVILILQKSLEMEGLALFTMEYSGMGVPLRSKRLYENNLRRAEQFMNEIEILAHLRHPNLDFVVRKMVTSVAELAFRCLQQQREMRPTMVEVLEILRRIEKENYGAEKPLVLDTREDDSGLFKHPPPPLELSPDSE
ncbi:hypothetical protein OIU78_000703 [Salix suchowensis]|nr:hypothetical protein OIU78_000703 [Salix suchowensis]